MCVPFDDNNILRKLQDAIGVQLGFSGLEKTMDDVHGIGTIHDIASDRDPRRTIGEKCVAYSRRHGMLADLFLSVANRTDVEDPLRQSLVEAVRVASSPFNDATGCLDEIVAHSRVMPLAEPHAAAIDRVRRFTISAGDCVERSGALKAMWEVASKLDRYSVNIAPLLEREEAVSDFVLANSQAHIDALEEAANTTSVLLKGLSRSQQDALDTRWAQGLNATLTAYRNALVDENLDQIRSARNVLKHLLDITIPRFEEDLAESVASLPLERVAVVLRHTTMAGLANFASAIAPMILRCRIALAYRRDCHGRWEANVRNLDALRGLLPTGPAPPGDAWLIQLADDWPAARTAVRTLCLLSPDPDLHHQELRLADAVGDQLATAVQGSADAVSGLATTLAAYRGFAAGRRALLQERIGQEIDQLAELRKILRAIQERLT